jgi:transcriptional repressor NrdR
VHCPFCNHPDTVVKDSRPADDGSSIRRRRQCPNCGGRFTTYERVQLRELRVVKRDGSRQPFDHDKLYRSIAIATRKRDVSEAKIEQLISSIQRQMEATGETDISSAMLGGFVMKALAATDPVAYVRYASVYRDFTSAEDFSRFIDEEVGSVRLEKS